MRAKLEALHEQIVQLMEHDPKIQLSSSMDGLHRSKPYRDFVAYGYQALPYCMQLLAEGRFYMNRAAFELSGIEAAKFYGEMSERFPSDQTVCAALVRWWVQGIASMSEMAPMNVGSTVVCENGVLR